MSISTFYRQIEVNSVEDLDAITTKMLTKPILFSTRVEISRRDYYNGYIIRGKIYTRYYCVCNYAFCVSHNLILEIQTVSNFCFIYFKLYMQLCLLCIP